MKIIIDAMGGDNAPNEIIRGACAARDELSCDIILVGDEALIKDFLKNEELSDKRIEIVASQDVITMHDSPLSIREKKNSSMHIGLSLLHEGKGDAFVSAGNTGALHTGATLFVKRINGVRRSAIASLMNFNTPLLLIDSGANITVTEEFLYQFAVMGSVYMKKMFAIENPSVGLLNNGTEESKGTPLYQAAYKLLSESKDINFIGNIEGKDIPYSKCDVIVCDGFTGNIALKTLEGMGLFVMKKIKSTLKSSFTTKIAALLSKKKLYKLKSEFDSSEYGGAPLLGVLHPVIKAHGSSDAKAIKNAVRQAITYSQTGIICEIEKIFNSADAEKLST